MQIGISLKSQNIALKNYFYISKKLRIIFQHSRAQQIQIRPPDRMLD